MIVTVGDLISELLDRFEHRLHDHELAAIATQVAVTEAIATSLARARTRKEKRFVATLGDDSTPRSRS